MINLAKEFIINKLQKIFNSYEDIKLRYEYRSDTHIVEVMPLQVFHDNEFILLENDLEIEFEESFPMEEILFISEESLTEIKTPIFELGYSTIFEFENTSIEFEFNEFETCVDVNNQYALAA